MKKVISLMLAIFMLMGIMPMCVSAAEFDPYNFEPITIDVQGYSSSQGFMVAVSSLSSLGITADDHEKLVGCMLSGTVTKTADESTITLTNVPILSTVKSDDSIIRLWVGEQNIDNGWWNTDPATYTAELTLSHVVDITNFDPITLDVQGYSSSQGFMVAVSSLSSLGITADDHEKLVGCMLSGTVTKTADGSTITLTNVPVLSTVKSDASIIRLWVGEQNIDNGWWNTDPATYTAELTISPAVDITNFNPITLDVQGYSSTQGFMIAVSSLSSLGITADDHEKLVGCMLSGTVTKTADGSTITLTNVPVLSTVKSDASIIRLWVGEQNIDNGWWNTDPATYTANLTISPASKVNETNFEPFKITVSAVGSDGSGHKRFVISNGFSFPITTGDQLKGCVLNGTATYKGAEEYSAVVPFVNVPVVAQPLRTDGRISLDFTAPTGYTIKESAVDEYEFDLTISPAVETDEFAPFKISVNRTGTPDETVTKRLLIINTLGIDVGVADQLKGCYLNGTATYTGTGEFSKTVVFRNVKVAAQPARTDGLIAIDFTVPAGYTLCLKGEEDANYAWDLTLSREASENLIISDVAVENNSITMTVSNDMLISAENLKLIAATYDSDSQDKMVEVKVVDLPNIASGNSSEIDGISFNSTDWTYVKVFIWKGIDISIPFADVVQASK